MTEHLDGDHLSLSSLIIFPAYNIGESEFLYFLKSLSNANLLDRMLLICPAHCIDMLQQVEVKYYILDDFGSFPLLVEKIEALKKKKELSFASVLGIDEELQFQLSKGIADHFGLEYYDDITCFTGANKYLLKSSFLKHGVPTSPFKLITEPDPESIRAVGFPSVLKVMSGSQSHYVFYNKNKKELLKHFGYLKRAVHETDDDPRLRPHNLVLDGQPVSLNPRTHFLLEAYAPGEEFSCDFLLQDNEIQVIRVVKKVKGPHFGIFKGYHLLTEKELQQECTAKSNLEKLCRGIAQSLSIETGLCMVDFKVHKGCITVLEASIRPGLSAFNQLMFEIYGYTSLALIFMRQMGMSVSVTLPERSGAVVYQYGTKTRPRRLLKRYPPKESDKRLEIISTYRYKEDPDCFTIGGVKSLPTLRGYVLVRSHEIGELPELADWFDGNIGYENRI